MGKDFPIYWPNLGQDCLPEEQAGDFETKAGAYWEAFHKQHQYGFFKDRHYLHREFPELATGSPSILEVGCGVGNTVFPLLEVNPRAFVYACDFSPTAVRCVQQHQQYNADRVKAFVADITEDRLAAHVPLGSIDICTAVFVLSAISPQMMRRAVENIASVVRPGGRVFVRDYAAGDMAECRFSDSSRLKCIGERFYVRGDGTRAFYFMEGDLRSLFADCGFACSYTRLFDRVVTNHALEVSMDRRWIQGLFQRTDSSAANIGLDGGPGFRLENTLALPAAGEWEDEQQLHSVEDGVAGLFDSDGGQEVVEERFRVPGAGSFVVRSLSREHKHTVAHTGLMLWDAAPSLAAHLAASSRYLNGKLVLELGCGSNPLCLLAALRGGRRVVSTDGSSKALQQMTDNISLNSSQVIVERARLHILEWGNQRHIRAIQRSYPRGFDVAFGADVAYVEELVPLLFRTAFQLLSDSPEARLLLCHLTRRVSEGKIMATAEECGFASLSQDAGSSAGGAIRLLSFAKKQDRES